MTMLVSVRVYMCAAAGYGQTYASMSWAGFIGSITGYSAANMAISEKARQCSHRGGWSSCWIADVTALLLLVDGMQVWLHYKGEFSMFGIPTTFLLEVSWLSGCLVA